MRVLGLHKDPWHNTGAALISDYSGKTQFVMVSEERLDRVKDSRSFPQKAIDACLKEHGLSSIREVDLVVLDYICNHEWQSDFHKTPCRQDTALYELPPDKIRVINHHLAHACSVFYSSGFDDAAVLIVDGRGSDNETQSLFLANQKEIKLLASTKIIGIGLLYSAITQTIGFGLLQEGKTMGLAPFGAVTKDSVFHFPHRYEGIVTDYSDVCVNGTYDLKVSHRPLVSFEDKARAAYEVQLECESAMLHLASWTKQATGMQYLCISGGVGLNSVANYKILQTGWYKDVFINPAASDAGIPLGAALYGYHKVMNGAKDYTTISPFIGPSYSDEEICRAISSSDGYAVVRDHALDHAVRQLVGNRIVACLHGRSEIGPRALGNRSILMSPLLAANKDILNSRVKHREAFRPFAPAVLEEYVSEFFDIDRPCPYMLFVPNVRADKRSVIPAVTHVDGTGRLQTVARDENPVLYKIIDSFGEVTGVPVLLNTSFNDNNEPIVETPEDAIKCFLGTNIDALLLEENTLLVKPGMV